MDMLALRGVPLTVAHNVAVSDTTTTAFAAAQRAFDEARGDGTPLLPVAEAGDDRGPARYVRNVITAMLVRHAEGGDPHPLGEDEMSAAAEAHMALIETVAAELANFTGEIAASVIPASRPATEPRFAAIEFPRAEWLSESILKSLVRLHSVDLPRSTAPQTDAGNPLVRLAEESAYWRGIPPHGAMEKSLSDQRSALTGMVKAAPPLKISSAFISNQEPEAIIPDDSWIRTESARLAGQLVGKLGETQAASPGHDTLKEGVLRKMSQSSTTRPGSGRATVIGSGTVGAFLANFDVMRDYVFQPM
jgi:hypothetical protein